MGEYVWKCNAQIEMGPAPVSAQWEWQGLNLPSPPETNEKVHKLFKQRC